MDKQIYSYIWIFPDSLEVDFTYTTITIFYVFKKVSYAHPSCIYLIKNTVKMLLWNIISI